MWRVRDFRCAYTRRSQTMNRLATRESTDIQSWILIILLRLVGNQNENMHISSAGETTLTCRRSSILVSLCKKRSQTCAFTANVCAAIERSSTATSQAQIIPCFFVRLFRLPNVHLANLNDWLLASAREPLCTMHVCERICKICFFSAVVSMKSRSIRQKYTHGCAGMEPSITNFKANERKRFQHNQRWNCVRISRYCKRNTNR